ncbi:hypothetical protein AGMMS49938_15060 [Fibrobacterales bacterium]|nr:hypothetical protein AGMMS49938_15060 [Fibrobacterales bacterium]
MVFLANWVIVCILWDIYLGIRRLCGKSKLANRRLRLKKQPLLAAAVGVIIAAFFLIGVPAQLNYKTLRENVTLAVHPQKPLKIAVFSDIHFDSLFPKSKLERITDSIRVLQPDAIFFVGDLSDIPATKLQERGFDSLFKTINAPLGFYAVTGNHESFMNPGGGTLEWLRNLGNAILLLDSTACNDYFCVTGRLDHSYAKRHSAGRVSLYKLAPHLLSSPPSPSSALTADFVPSPDSQIPWFLLDHQPKGLDPQDLADSALTRLPDFAFSGHTHAGQFFPVTVLIHAMWKIAYGYGEIDNIPWFVSAGIDQWGPPIRIGSKTELVLFTFN